jgi:hypothetical protein
MTRRRRGRGYGSVASIRVLDEAVRAYPCTCSGNRLANDEHVPHRTAIHSTHARLRPILLQPSAQCLFVSSHLQYLFLLTMSHSPQASIHPPLLAPNQGQPMPHLGYAMHRRTVFHHGPSTAEQQRRHRVQASLAQPIHIFPHEADSRSSPLLSRLLTRLRTDLLVSLTSRL